MKEIRKIKIPGVTGLRYLSIFDRFDGRRDYRTNQLCEEKGGITTPRTIQKCRSCDQFTNTIYLDAVEELKVIYPQIVRGIEELCYCDDDKSDGESRPADGTEESRRQIAACAAKKKAKALRKKQLVLDLAELRQQCNNIDETLRHNVDRARSVLRAHIQSYWAGVLHHRATNERLPVSPIMIEEDLSGRSIYAEHRSKIENLWEEYSKGGEV